MRDIDLPTSNIDTFIDELIEHEQSATDENDSAVWHDVSRWRGLPKLEDKQYNQTPYLWLWQGNTRYHKQGIENFAPEGTCDLIFIVADYLPKYDDGLLRTDILQRQNSLVKKLETSLIDSRFVGAVNGIVFNPLRYLMSGKAASAWGYAQYDTVQFYYGGSSQVFPFTGKPLREDWYVSVITMSAYFDNRD